MRLRTRDARAAVDERVLEQLAQLVGDRLGLHFPPERRAELRRGVLACADESGLADADRFLESLLHKAPGEAQLRLLARHLTIGETYFFRDPQLMAALAGKVLPELIGQRRGRDQRLRLWSAGCASGEEAYTLAILLHRALPDLADWQVSITATDVNPASLRKADAGLYGDWSFRSIDPQLKAAYFERRPDGRHQVAPFLRSMVRFGELNLVEDGYPSPESGTTAVDILFCRNVLMYFGPAQVAAVVARLRHALADGGWLAVSPSETSQALFAPLATVNHPGAILYRKQARPAARERARAAPAPRAGGIPRGRGGAAPAAAGARPAPDGVALAEQHCRAGRFTEAAGILAQVAPRQPLDARLVAMLARALANQGELAQALAWCERWIGAEKLEPAAHYLRAVVLLEQGQADKARAALRRAVFLDPGFVLAHFALGTAARRAGHGAAAARHFRNARDLLARYRPDELLPEGDGLNAGRLARILSAFLEGAAG